MKRSLVTFAMLLKRKGVLWPARLAAGMAGSAASGVPRSLAIEPTEACTGGCRGCAQPASPAFLEAGAMVAWLDSRPSRPVTVHFAGRHSDPLASQALGELASLASAGARMVSVSTIGLGMPVSGAPAAVDRWIFSLPAASPASWRAIRGEDRLEEALSAIRLASSGGALVEVVLTLWKPSAADGPAFEDLARREGWGMTGTVFGLYDPSGHHVGRREMLPLDDPACPWGIGPDGSVVLRREPGRCPFADCLFLDARAVLRPCPFAGPDAPLMTSPSGASWMAAKGWRRFKLARAFDSCRYCP